jgi:hypothetical protein
MSLFWERTAALECPRCGKLASFAWKSCPGCDAELGQPLSSEPQTTVQKLTAMLLAASRAIAPRA